MLFLDEKKENNDSRIRVELFEFHTQLRKLNTRLSAALVDLHGVDQHGNVLTAAGPTGYAGQSASV